MNKPKRQRLSKYEKEIAAEEGGSPIKHFFPASCIKLQPER